MSLYDRPRPPGAFAAGAPVRLISDDRDGGGTRGLSATASPAAGRRVRGGQPAQLAAAAQEAGRFDDEIVPISVPQRRGEPVHGGIDRDEGVCLDSTPRSHEAAHDHPGGTVTAGNASQQNDAAGGPPRRRRGRAGRARWNRSSTRGLGGGRVRPGDDGHRSGPGGGEAVRPHRPVVRRPRPSRFNVRRSPSRCSCSPSAGLARRERLNVNGSDLAWHPVGATGMHPDDRAARAGAAAASCPETMHRRSGMAALFVAP
ncbi:hypothetical protein HBB16_12620 [Pseudonocardia sp. MCCB 268]|nr:hypothetical protein [Pseudonocardia cytotoxica]